MKLGRSVVVPTVVALCALATALILWSFHQGAPSPKAKPAVMTSPRRVEGGENLNGPGGPEGDDALGRAMLLRVAHII